MTQSVASSALRSSAGDTGAAEGGAEARQDREGVHDSADLFLEKDVGKESAVKHRRVWVRVTRLCNQRCIFCLDSWNQNGTYVPVDELKAFIRRGKQEGGERLILSGGEASVHPGFIKLIRYGREVGYDWVQTVTNGMMFAYPEYARRAKVAGLNEVTLSIHGHTAKLHDRLVGFPGAFEKANQAIRNLQALGGVVVNIDVVINKLNVKHLREILDFYMEMGIHEFDLLFIVPFGRGFEEYREQLFFDIEDHYDDLQRAFEVAQRPGVYLWTNRFPVHYLEGYEHLIQDPHKLHSEVNGGRHNFEGFLKTGTLPDCHGERCDHCFLDGLCRTTMFAYRRQLEEGQFETIRLESGGKLSAHVMEKLGRQSPACVEVDAGQETSSAEGLGWQPSQWRVRVETPAEADEALAREGVNALRCAASSVLDQLVAADLREVSEVWVDLNRDTTDWLLTNNQALGALSGIVRAVLINHEYMSGSREQDPTPSQLSALAQAGVPLTNVPACIAGSHSRPGEHRVLHVRTLDDDGDFDTDRYVDHYIHHEYYVRSLRCGECVHADSCRGMHINYIRNHGFKVLEPVSGDAQ